VKKPRTVRVENRTQTLIPYQGSTQARLEKGKLVELTVLLQGGAKLPESLLERVWAVAKAQKDRKTLLKMAGRKDLPESIHRELAESTDAKLVEAWLETRNQAELRKFLETARAPHLRSMAFVKLDLSYEEAEEALEKEDFLVWFGMSKNMKVPGSLRAKALAQIPQQGRTKLRNEKNFHPAWAHGLVAAEVATLLANREVVAKALQHGVFETDEKFETFCRVAFNEEKNPRKSSKSLVRGGWGRVEERNPEKVTLTLFAAAWNHAFTHARKTALKEAQERFVREAGFTVESSLLERSENQAKELRTVVEQYGRENLSWQSAEAVWETSSRLPHEGRTAAFRWAATTQRYRFAAALLFGQNPRGSATSKSWKAQYMMGLEENQVREVLKCGLELLEVREDSSTSGIFIRVGRARALTERDLLNRADLLVNHITVTELHTVLQNSEGVGRVAEHVGSVLATEFGKDAAKWQMFEKLSETFAGTFTELVEAVNRL